MEDAGGLYGNMASIEFILPANHNWFHLIVPTLDVQKGNGQTGLFLSINNIFCKVLCPAHM
jgi:hypothetical protein